MIYRLKYEDIESAISDLKSVGVINDQGEKMGLPTHNIVFVGKIPNQYAIYDNEGNEIAPTTYKEGFHVDVMDDREDLTFSGEITDPESPYHSF